MMKSKIQFLVINSFKTRVWILAVLLITVLPHFRNAAAQTVGTITSLEGSLLDRKTNGIVKILTLNSAVEQGDMLESPPDSYAQIKFIDNTEITLRPNTQFKIDNYSYNEANPENDHSVFSLIKGSLRSITGLLGQRNKVRYQLNTPAATIGIRGTTYIAEYIAPKTNDQIDLCKEDKNSDCKKLPGGLYTEVIEGAISATNDSGTQLYTVGQFGYTASKQQTPEVLPNNPGIVFELPFKKLGNLECQIN